MTQLIPKRIRWAVETLAVEPTDRLLEIGGGPGVAASLVCERLTRGSLLVIDRSATAIERTRRRNLVHVRSGRLALETVDVADFEPGTTRFDKAFAVNVNVFWTTPATEELSKIRKTLDHDGRVFLFYETPNAARAGRRSRVSPTRCVRTASQSRSSSPAPQHWSGAWRPWRDTAPVRCARSRRARIALIPELAHAGCNQPGPPTIPSRSIRRRIELEYARLCESRSPSSEDAPNPQIE